MTADRFRLPVVVAVCGLALLLAGCSSNNKGKIEGKWKVVSMPKTDADLEKVLAMGVAMVVEFRADNTLHFSFVAEKPEAEAMAKLLTSQPGAQKMSGQYSLGSGDTVNFSG